MNAADWKFFQQKVPSYPCKITPRACVDLGNLSSERKKKKIIARGEKCLEKARAAFSSPPEGSFSIGWSRALFSSLSPRTCCCRGGREECTGPRWGCCWFAPPRHPGMPMVLEGKAALFLGGEVPRGGRALPGRAPPRAGAQRCSPALLSLFLRREKKKKRITESDKDLFGQS